LLLTGSGDGHFAPVDLERDHLVIEGQVRHLAWLRRAGGGRLIVVARNNDRLDLLRPSGSGPADQTAAARSPR
jgi:hypothetical protein